MEEELDVLMGAVAAGTVVVGTVVVGIAVVLPVGSYLYVQQPCLGVLHNQVAGQQLLYDNPKQNIFVVRLS